MGKYLCSTREDARYWFNWNCCGIFTCVFIHGLFIWSNLFMNVMVVACRLQID